MEAYQMGNQAAFTLLLDRHSGRVFGFLFKRTQNQGDAKDLLQETFFKLHRSRHLYNTTLPFLPWLFSITRSVLLDHYKKKKPLEDLVEPVELDRLAAPVFPQESQENRLTLLTGMQREAVHLRVYDEATFEEIASKLSTSPDNARQLVSRGLKRLRKILSKDREEP
jgi:RNA polymerase sigma-70 factor (ECF subfamily)